MEALNEGLLLKAAFYYDKNKKEETGEAWPERG
jgi:hypothetical protein